MLTLRLQNTEITSQPTLGLDEYYSFFPTYYSILIFSNFYLLFFFKLPIVLFILPIILIDNNYYSSILMTESGQNGLHTLHFYPMTKQ